MHSILKINAALFARLFTALMQLPAEHKHTALTCIEAIMDEQATSDEQDAATEKLVELLMHP